MSSKNRLEYSPVGWSGNLRQCRLARYVRRFCHHSRTVRIRAVPCACTQVRFNIFIPYFKVCYVRVLELQSATGCTLKLPSISPEHHSTILRVTCAYVYVVQEQLLHRESYTYATYEEVQLPECCELRSSLDSGPNRRATYIHTYVVQVE